MTVGLIGESPFDTDALAVLLSRHYQNQIIFKPLVQNIKGGELDCINPESIIHKQIRSAYQRENLDFVIHFRDLDGIESDADKMADRLMRMYRIGDCVNQNVVYMLCIFEIETLLLSDVASVNNYYSSGVVFPNVPITPEDPMHQNDPKGYLRIFCPYNPSDCPELFKLLDLERVQQVRFYSTLLTDVNSRIN